MYKCECGKEFETPSSFNGHKSSCIEHLIAVEKITSKDEWLQMKRNQNKKGQATHKNNWLLKKQQLLDIWISEKHVCEHCGKIMTEKFGSGRFCSRSCSNTRQHSQQTKDRIAKSITGKTRVSKKVKNYLLEYNNNPSKCSICGNPLVYVKRYQHFCNNPKCKSQYMSQKLTLAHAEGRHPGYKYHNEESYPERYIKQFLIDNNIEFKCQVPIFNGKSSYHLDFEINGNIDLEVDGRFHESEIYWIEHDKIRDNFMLNLGYKIYRFKWCDPHKKELMKSKLDNLLSWLNLNT